MKTRNYGDTWPHEKEFLDAWRWVVAIDAFDYDHRQPLSDLVKSEAVPEELRPIIAKIVSGDRSPNRRAAAKLKIPAAERMQIAGSISTVLYVIDAIKYDAVDPENHPGEKGVTMLSLCNDRGKGREPAEITRELEGEARKVIEDSARQLNVSDETIENLLRYLRAKMEAYPNI